MDFQVEWDSWKQNWRQQLSWKGMNLRSRNCAQRSLVYPINRKKQEWEKERMKEKAGKKWRLGPNVNGRNLCQQKLNTCDLGRCKGRNRFPTVHNIYPQERFLKHLYNPLKIQTKYFPKNHFSFSKYILHYSDTFYVAGSLKHIFTSYSFLFQLHS